MFFLFFFCGWLASPPSLFLSMCIQVNLALKQKSDIEHYRNKLRLKAKRKGYYDFPSAEGKGSTKDLSQRHRYSHDRPPHPHSRALEQEDDRGSTFVKDRRRWVILLEWELVFLNKIRLFVYFNSYRMTIRFVDLHKLHLY